MVASQAPVPVDTHPGEALSELQEIRPLLAEGFGANSTQVRNLDKQIGRLELVGDGNRGGPPAGST